MISNRSRFELKERTKRELFEYASSLQARLDRKVSFDGAIKLSLEEKKGVEEERRRFNAFFGSVPDDRNSAWEELEKGRKADRLALEKKAATQSSK